MKIQHKLLPANALKGKSVGISVSESPDLQQLGLIEDHFRMTLADIARTIMFAGGSIYYGGHLRADGYTQFLLNELQRYGNREKPFKICLSHTEHQKMSADDLSEQRDQIGLFGDIIFLDTEGNPVEFSENEDHKSYDPTPELLAKSLSGLRSYMTKVTTGRVVLGGKRTGFLGRYPGIIEEVIASVEAGKPLYLVGGFGGATMDAISALQAEHAEWFVRYTNDEQDSNKLAKSLVVLRCAAESSQDWKKNGLSSEQNALLAATYRSSEIAALLGYGLGTLNG
ncbi:MAG: hypothetical protein ACSHXB_17570 [Sulfitobacter sp.]